MKNLSIEEKAKAYDEAIINCSRLWECGEITRENYEYIFPELKESEDERIRKELITHCRNTRCVTEEGAEKIAKWIAWLEKQEEKSLTVDIESMIEAYEQRLINQGNGVRNSPIVNMCVAAFKHGVENTLDELHLKQGKQKPYWSEEDEERLKSCLSILQAKGIMGVTDTINSNWLKSLKERL